MKKYISSFLALAILFSPVLGFGATTNQVALTTSQIDQLNQIGAPSSITSARQTLLGTALNDLINGSATLSPTANSGVSSNFVQKETLTTPVDTTGTNGYAADDMSITLGASSGGTNTVTGLNIEAITGTANVTLNGIKIGALTGSAATENAINIASGWDNGLTTASPITNTSTTTLGSSGQLTVDASGNFATTGTVQGPSLDRASAAALTLGPTNATSVNVVPNFNVNTNKFSVLAASGNTTVAGTLGVTGATTYTSTVGGPSTGFGTYSTRQRVTIATANAGGTVIAAAPGASRKIRLINCKLIAIGGNLSSTNLTSFKLQGTQTASPVALFTVAKAQLTQSAVNQIGTASTTVLADGASFVANDVNTGVTLEPVGGSDGATSTNIDVELTYAIE